MWLVSATDGGSCDSHILGKICLPVSKFVVVLNQVFRPSSIFFGYTYLPGPGHSLSRKARSHYA